MPSALAEEELSPGDKVEVRSRFNAQWARGFEVIDVDDAGVRVRRISDGEILPVAFAEIDVRKARKRANDFWWM
jgi:hypothetical protein